MHLKLFRNVSERKKGGKTGNIPYIDLTVVRILEKLSFVNNSELCHFCSPNIHLLIRTGKHKQEKNRQMPADMLTYLQELSLIHRRLCIQIVCFKCTNMRVLLAAFSVSVCPTYSDLLAIVCKGLFPAQPQFPAHNDLIMI